MFLLWFCLCFCYGFVMVFVNGFQPWAVEDLGNSMFFFAALQKIIENQWFSWFSNIRAIDVLLVLRPEPSNFIGFTTFAAKNIEHHCV